MSYYTRQKQAYLPMSVFGTPRTSEGSGAEPTARSSGNAAESYVSFQDSERAISRSPRSRFNAFLAADGEEEVESDGVGFGTH